MRKRREWTPYSVGEPSTKPNWTNSDCSPFETVYHICHVKDAFRYIEDGDIKSSLVWDESKLRNTRTCVSWLSPNLWSAGSLYGNIRFDFEWPKLVKGKKFYWVEAMTNYRPTAYRILITDDESFGLTEYPPEDGDGPLYYDKKNDIWYCNGDLTGEFMVDSDLSLRKCSAVGFVHHHDVLCRKDGSGCADRRQRGAVAGAKLIARLIAQKTVYKNEPLQSLFLDDDEFNRDTGYAWDEILRSFSRVETSGNMEENDAAARPIVLAMLDRFAAGRSRKDLGALFRNSEELELALRHGAASAFGIPLSKVPGSEDV